MGNYSTVTQLRNNIKLIDTDIMDDAQVTTRIVEADKEIRKKLSNLIDFSLLPSDPTDADFPEFINLLSQYKTAELCLVYAYGALARAKEQPDRVYWADLFKDNLADILAGKVALELPDSGTSIGSGTATFSQDSKPGVAPALGEGEFADNVTDDELLEERPLP